jgi:ABC-type uncharacterized transport system substrate-binding protein
VLSESAAVYQEAALAVRRELPDTIQVTIRTVDEFERVPAKAPVLSVALGTRALRAVLATGPNAPVIATLIPRSSFDLEVANLARGSGAKALTAVFLDQPFPRQVNLLRLVVPKRTRVGVLASAGTDDTVLRLEAAAKARGLAVVREQVSDSTSVPIALARLLGESDVLLALPDPAIYNSGTIHNILFSALRSQQPLIGFSEAYVRAGALAAVYSKPQQVGRQAGEIAARAIAGVPLPPPQYPRTFSVSVNATVAHTLGLAVEDESALLAKLVRMDREP